MKRVHKNELNKKMMLNNDVDIIDVNNDVDIIY